MQNLEVIIYILLSIVIGGLLLGFLFKGYAEDFYQSQRKLADRPEFQIESTTFASELSDIWEDCSLGVINRTYAVYVADTATISIHDVILELSRLDQCDKIDCFNESNRFWMPQTIQTPKLINIECTNMTLVVSKR